VDWILTGALLIVIGMFAYQQFLPAPGAATAERQQKGAAVVGAAATTEAGAISIAVLPFANLSGDTNQEFFSDGITEEITSALAKIADLHVVARTSAYQFKGEKKDMRTIGQMLGATHLIEGSVRKAGNRLRITAQLIKSQDGTHIWTENYDRELTDVFAIQEDIATAIAGALRTPLGLKPGERLVANRNIDPESYEQHLRAKALVRARGLKNLTEAAVALEQVVARNPDFAPAWAQLAFAYGLAAQGVAKAEAAAQRSIQLDPNLADGYLFLAVVQWNRTKWVEADGLISRALSLDPYNPDVLRQSANLLGQVGRLKEALAIEQRIVALEPSIPAFNANLAQYLWFNGQDDSAIALLKDPSIDARDRASDLARIYAARGQYGDAADALTAAPSGTFPPETLTAAVRLLRTAPVVAGPPQDLPELRALDFIYLYVGASARALEYYEARAGSSAPRYYAYLWHSSYASVRKTERFKSLARKVGFVEYWRERGWPDLCRPMGADDFVCD
jgi:TolB-like protein/tetratricopeptide (TPR) repeat protein